MYADELIESLKRYTVECAYFSHLGMKDRLYERMLPGWWDK